MFFNPYTQVVSELNKGKKSEIFTELLSLFTAGRFTKARKIIEENNVDLNTLIYIDDEDVYLGGEFTGYPLLFYYIFLGKLRMVKLLIELGAKPNLEFYGGYMKPLDGIKLLDTEGRINMFFKYLEIVMENNSWNDAAINKKHLKAVKLIKLKYVDSYNEFIFLNNELYTFIN